MKELHDLAQPGNSRVVGSLVPPRLGYDLVFVNVDLRAELMEPGAFGPGQGAFVSFGLPHKKSLLESQLYLAFPMYFMLPLATEYQP
jgi:hypothetical protein